MGPGSALTLVRDDERIVLAGPSLLNSIIRHDPARCAAPSHLRARSSVFQSVVTRNGILIRSRVHRTTSIGSLPRASPSDRAPRGWGTIWGGGIKGWGKVTRSGLLGTPDLVLSRLNAISRRRLDQPCGAKSFWAGLVRAQRVCGSIVTVQSPCPCVATMMSPAAAPSGIGADDPPPGS